MAENNWVRGRVKKRMASSLKGIKFRNFDRIRSDSVGRKRLLPAKMFTSTSTEVRYNRGGSRISFRRGCTRLLLHFNTKNSHSFFFFSRIPVVLENRRSSQEGGVRTPCTLPLDPPLYKIQTVLGIQGRSQEETTTEANTRSVVRNQPYEIF